MKRCAHLVMMFCLGCGGGEFTTAAEFEPDSSARLPAPKSSLRDDFDAGEPSRSVLPDASADALTEASPALGPYDTPKCNFDACRAYCQSIGAARCTAFGCDCG
jgi:hypothetical protein